MRTLLAVSTALLLLGASPQNVIPPVGETIDVSIVNLDVVVTDRKGNRVRGLTSDDFIVLENGRPQAITNFAEYADTAAPQSELAVEGMAAQVPQPPMRKRTIILFADRLPLRSFDATAFFDALRSTIHRVVRPGDALMIVSWLRGQPLVRLSFTDDLSAADEVLAQMKRESDFTTTRFDRTIQMERDFYRTAAELAASRGFTVDFSEGDPTLSELADSELAKNDLLNKLQTIRTLMQAISADEGKKVIVLATHRLSRIAGKDVRTRVGAMAGPRTITDMHYDMQRSIEEMIRTANANDITLYTLFPEGIGTDLSVDAEIAESPGVGARANIILDNELESLQLVADRTGGKMEWAASEIVEMLPAIEADLNQYYSLAYRVPSTGRDRGRNIKVKTKDSALRVRARKEFVEKSDDTRMRDRVTSNLLREIPGGSIPIEVAHGTIVKRGKTWRAPLRVRIPVASLMTVAGKDGNDGSFSVFVGWNSVLGRLGQVTKETRRFVIRPGDPQRASFTYDFELNLDQLTENIAVGVFDEVSKEYGVARVELPPRGEE